MKRAFFVLLLAAACGPTIGDPCTTDSDCLGQTCLNDTAEPGGYCSESCSSDAQCPTGSACVDGVLPHGGGKGCLHLCGSSTDCRNGYKCNTVNGTNTAVCFGS